MLLSTGEHNRIRSAKWIQRIETVAESPFAFHQNDIPVHAKEKMNRSDPDRWDWIIHSRTQNWNWDFSSLHAYRHLLARMVRKDFLVNYQQTILGPLWIFVQPLLTLFTYVLVFGKMIRIPTGSDVPPVLFYICGIVLWNFFNENFLITSRTFRENIQVFSKVYFPRIIIPFSVSVTQFLRFLIQLSLMFMILAWHVLFNDYHVQWNWKLAVLPLAIAGIAFYSMGIGLVFSVLTAKYRDIINMVEVCIRLLFFVTPVVYPVSAIPQDMQWLTQLNPLTPFFEWFRLALIGKGEVSISSLTFSFIISILLLLWSIHLFNRQGSRLIDIV